MRPLPFRLRIALLSALISGVVLVTVGGWSWWLIRRQKFESMDTEIRSLGARHPGWFAGRGGYERLNNALEFIFGPEHREQVILLVKDGVGKTVFTSAGWPRGLDPESLDCSLRDQPGFGTGSDTDLNRAAGDAVGVGDPAGGHGGWGRGMGGGRGGPPPVTFTKIPRFETVRGGGAAWRIGMLGTRDMTLVVGLNLAPLEVEVNRVRNIYLAVLPVALLAVGCGGWWVAGRAVRPLRRVTDAVERVTARGLDQRVPESAEDPEFARLIRVFNGMMDRLEASFHQATRFSADASHELKTPLTIMQAEVENALQAAERGSREQVFMASLLEEIRRLRDISRSLLLLAQADAGRLALVREPADLAGLLRETVEDVAVLAEESRIGVTLSAPPELRVQVDTALLRQAIMNVLLNAIRHNEPDGWIQVEASVQAGRVVLRVCNGGPGIAGPDQARIFDRFHRSDTARARSGEGTGLGLSLAREIVRAHGGELALAESRPGRTCFELALPLETAVGAEAHGTGRAVAKDAGARG